ncbi:MAG: adenylate kinase [Elusimicrobia bacterium HGW-Elusimicrobia-1]|jgi:adenylate kinase|nr:MAG: adenylate kinase [Elusimicrobia bacterium HGW-Elusimicrobia-1]
MDIILLGPPGAGKGTQAELLVKDFDLKHLSTGEIFRSELKDETPLGKRIKEFMGTGGLVPDDIVLEVIDSYVKKNAKLNFLFDGFPRTVPQAEGLSKILASSGRDLAAIVYVNVPDEEVVRRLSSRRTCKSCGAIHNLATGPLPSADGKCAKCGGELLARADDKEAIIKERLLVYRAQTAPLIEYYSRKMPQKFIESDGSAPINEVYGVIKAAVRERLARK